MATWDDSTTTAARGTVTIRQVGAPKKFVVFSITATLSDKGTWDQFTVTKVTEGEAPENEKEVSVEFSRTGDTGAKGETGEKGTKGETGEKGADGAPGATGSEDWKSSCRVATTANVTISTALNEGDEIDGVKLVNGDRVLAWKQTTKSQNGIYVVSASPARATDADAAGELSGGTTVRVEKGTRNEGRAFYITTEGSITPGTTAHDWEVTEPKDFKRVTELPTSKALADDTCKYVADKTNGIIWNLIYDGEGEYPWKKIGGPALFARETALKETKSTTPQTTGAPSLTTPLKGDYRVSYGAREIRSGSGELVNGIIGLYYDGAQKEGAEDAGDSFNRNTAYVEAALTGLAAAKVLQTRYWASSEAFAVQFEGLFVKADPIRVG